MTVGKISVICWTIFVVMSAAFLPVGAAILAITALPHGARVVLVPSWWSACGGGRSGTPCT
jgi:hypothetical protein